MIKPEKESSSFGYYLQSKRLEQNITLEKVAEETRIAMSNLTLIEKEDLASLPDSVFVKGFLRSYAQAIGADADEAVRLYEARLDMKSRLEEAEKFQPRPKLSAWRNLIISVLSVLGLMALCLYSVSYYQQQNHFHEATDSSAGNEPAAEAHSTDRKLSDAQAGSAPEKKHEKMVLQVNALDDTWVKIIVDNHEPKEYNLRSGEQMEEEATTGYNLLIGNAGGVKLTLNGEPVIISGKEGEIVNIQIP
jgi:cytoskeletal protein RodZ